MTLLSSGTSGRFSSSSSTRSCGVRRDSAQNDNDANSGTLESQNYAAGGGLFCRAVGQLAGFPRELGIGVCARFRCGSARLAERRALSGLRSLAALRRKNSRGAGFARPAVHSAAFSRPDSPERRLPRRGRFGAAASAGALRRAPPPQAMPSSAPSASRASASNSLRLGSSSTSPRPKRIRKSFEVR